MKNKFSYNKINKKILLIAQWLILNKKTVYSNYPFYRYDKTFKYIY